MMSEETLQGEAALAAPESGVTATPETEDNGAPAEAETPKTFTQEELDAILSKRLAKEQRKWEREQRERAAEAERPAVKTAPTRDQFSTEDEYLEAASDFKAEQKVAARENQRQRTEVEAVFDDREEEARAKYDDYEDVTRNPNLKITTPMYETIQASEIGPDIAYHLGMNPKEADRISRLSPLLQAKEIGKIEASLNAGTITPAAKKVSSAPEPITPVAARTTSRSHDPTDPRSTKTMSPSEWINARNRDLAKKNA